MRWKWVALAGMTLGVAGIPSTTLWLGWRARAAVLERVDHLSEVEPLRLPGGGRESLSFCKRTGATPFPGVLSALDIVSLHPSAGFELGSIGVEGVFLYVRRSWAHVEVVGYVETRWESGLDRDLADALTAYLVEHVGVSQVVIGWELLDRVTYRGEWRAWFD